MASGAVSTFEGITISITLFAIAFFVSFKHSHQDFWKYSLVYFLCSLLYSFYLKKVLIADVLCLGGFYTSRILIGGVAAKVETSSWLLGTSFFFFIGLAFLKRFIELLGLEANQRFSRRAYKVDDKHLLAAFGVSSGMIALLLLVLYTSLPNIAPLYSHPERLWFAVVILLYWTARLWFLAVRNELHEDPIVFALKDWASYLTILILVCIFSWAT